MKLSIITAGRNDNYGGDFRGRALKAIEWNQAEAEQYGIDVEWVFVEWNPVHDGYLSYELAVKYGFTCYVVAPAVHDLVIDPDVAGQMTFCQFQAINVGLRRATGDWLLCTHPDDILCPDVWQWLAMGEKDDTVLYRARRYDIPPEHFATSIERMIEHRGLDHGGGYTNAAGDFLCFHAVRRRGFDEEKACFSDIHTDGRFVRNWIAEWTGGKTDWDKRYCRFIGTVFKCDHPMIYRRTAGEKKHHRGKRKWDAKVRECEGPGLYENLPIWGLSRRPIRELQAGVWLIE